MSAGKSIVINTGPILAIVSALGDLKVLHTLFESVIVPYEVCDEIMFGGKEGFGVKEFEEASWLKKNKSPVKIMPFLKNSLDIPICN